MIARSTRAKGRMTRSMETRTVTEMQMKKTAKKVGGKSYRIFCDIYYDRFIWIREM